MKSAVFRTRDLPAAERVDALRHLLENDGFAPVEARIHDGAEVDAVFTTGAVGGLHIASGRHGPGEVHLHRAPRHIRRSDPQLYKIIQVTSGRSVLDVEGRQTVLGPGDFAVVDTSTPMRWTYTLGAVCVAIPKNMLPLQGGIVGGRTAIGIPSGSDGLGAVAAALIARLPHQLRRGGNSTAARLGSAVIDLVSVAIAERVDDATAPPESHRQALLTRIHTFIEERLGDPELSPTAIAQAHHISNRYLHKLFQTEQLSVSDWIRQRRLERCRTDLLDPRTRTQPVSAVGARWGYPNPAHFNRSFRKMYGMPPGEVPRAGLTPAPGRQLSARAVQQYSAGSGSSSGGPCR